MSQALDRPINPYASPTAIESEPPTILQRMNALRLEYENRYGQLFSDGVIAAEFSVTFSLIAWKLSEQPSYAAVAAVGPVVVIGIEAVRDFLAKASRFPSEMEKLREESQREWLVHGRNVE